MVNKKKLADRAKRLKTDIPAVFLAMSKKETPAAAKIVAWIIIAYALSPIDLIPDFIPVLGYLDDILILPMLITLAVKLIPNDVFEECRRETEVSAAAGTSKKWYYALPVALFWIILLSVVIKAILK